MLELAWLFHLLLLVASIAFFTLFLLDILFLSSIYEFSIIQKHYEY